MVDLSPDLWMGVMRWQRHSTGKYDLDRQRINRQWIGSRSATTACLRMMGGMPSPPMALEGSSEVRAVKVSSKEMLIEQRELSGKDKVSSVKVSALPLKTE